MAPTAAGPKCVMGLVYRENLATRGSDHGLLGLLGGESGRAVQAQFIVRK